MTKGKLIKELKAKGIRKSATGAKLEHCKTYEIIKLYYDKCVD